MNFKKYTFKDTFIKTCEYENGQAACIKSREAEKCIDNKCEKVNPVETKKDIMIDHNNKYNKIIDSYNQSGGNINNKDKGVIKVNFDNFDTVLKSKIPFFIDFYAEWCGHCKDLQPIWKDLSNQVDCNKILIGKYEATEKLPKDITIDGFPTIILFKNGEKIIYEGNRQVKDFKNFLNTHTTQSGGSGTGERQKIYRFRSNLFNNFSGCKGECNKIGGCGPMCLAPLLLLGAGSRKKLKSKIKSKIKSKSKSKLRLIKIVKSTRPDKKLMAVFEKNGKQKITHFGSFGMSDFTKHKDPERKKRYLARHTKRENWNDPVSAGSLSKYILWNKTSLRASIDDYKKHFHFT